MIFYRPHPTYPLAAALIDFWVACDLGATLEAAQAKTWIAHEQIKRAINRPFPHGHILPAVHDRDLGHELNEARR